MGGAMMQQLMKRAPSMMGATAKPAPSLGAPMAPLTGMAMPSMAKMPAPSPGVSFAPQPKPMQTAPGMAGGMVAPSVRDQLMRRAPVMAGRR